jgi:hypothetical protein
MTNVVFWDVMPCGSFKSQHFGGMYHLHLQGENNQQTRNMLAVAFTDYFHFEEGGNTLHRHVGFYKSHMASHPRRRHSIVIAVKTSNLTFPPTVCSTMTTGAQTEISQEWAQGHKHLHQVTASICKTFLPNQIQVSNFPELDTESCTLVSSKQGLCLGDLVVV